MPNSDRPNFVFIITDQQRRADIGCYGNSVCQTPNLDRLASQGVVFERAFCANVISSPSRASILTGRYPQAHRLITNGCALPEDEVTLPQVLAENGYRTACMGKIHLAPVNPPEATFGTEPGGYESPEDHMRWREGYTLKLPYVGYQQVRLCNAHGGTSDDYYNHLVAIDPKLPSLLERENALVEPSGAPASWKSAIPEEHHSSTWVADESIKMLEEYAQGDEPFHLTVSIPDPHFPYCPPAPWCDMYDPADVPMPHRDPCQFETGSAYLHERIKKLSDAFGIDMKNISDDWIREIIAHTYGMVSLLDKQVGRVLDALERLGLRDNTIVVFTTDHGEHLGDHWLVFKAAQFDELTHLPLIWSCPRKFGEARRYDGISSHVDLMPTMLDLAGCSLPRGVQGRSYRAALEHGEDCGREFAYIEDDDDGGHSRMRTCWTPRYRMTYRLPPAEGELYDLESDPHEFIDRWSDPQYAQARAEMTELMLQGAMDAADPKPPRYSSC